MKERPILFSAPMVRALLDGSKTQTRRPVKWQGPKGFPHFFDRAFTDNPAGVKRLCVPFHHPEDQDAGEGNPAHRHYPPYGDAGDRLWVRETFMQESFFVPCDVRYRATDEPYVFGPPIGNIPRNWTPSIFMPRWASRINLEIVSVRVELLQDITELDAIAEGIERDEHGWNKYGCPDESAEDPCDSYKSLWEQINGHGSWDANPWVWVVEFKRDLDRKEGQV